MSPPSTKPTVPPIGPPAGVHWNGGRRVLAGIGPWLLCLSIGIASGLGAALGGADGSGSMLAATLAALVAAVGWRWVRASIRTAFVVPMQEVLISVRTLRQGGNPGRVLESGSSLARAMVRAQNEAAAFLQERQRRMQAALLSLEIAHERVNTVLQSMGEGVLVVDTGGELVFANAAAQRFLAAEVRAVLGRELVKAVDPGLACGLVEGLRLLEQQGLTTSMSRGVPFERNYLDVAFTKARSPRTGEDHGHVIVLIDVTQSFEVARIKDEFLSSVSHELRTPLTNVVSFAELLAQMPLREDAPEVSEFASIILAEARRLSRLVEDVLECNQIYTGTILVEQQKFDARSVLQHALDLFSETAKQRGVGLRLDTMEEPLLVHTDARHLQKVLARLLENALKFTPEGGHVRLSGQSEHGQVVLSVSDDGPGIAPALRERVFERFFQIGDPLTSKPPGTGLGLTICKSIIERLDGQIWCEAAPDGGARFVLVLPAVPGPRATAVQKAVVG